MVVTTTLAAYAFARLRFRGRDLVFGLFLSMMMIPTELVVITNFVTITNMGLRNTFAGLVLPSITSVFYTYLLKENFEQVPDELYRAAQGGRYFRLQISVEGHAAHLPPHACHHHDPKAHRMLELLRLAAPHHRRPGVLSCLQRHPGDPRKRFSGARTSPP